MTFVTAREGLAALIAISRGHQRVGPAEGGAVAPVLPVHIKGPVQPGARRQLHPPGRGPEVRGGGVRRRQLHGHGGGAGGDARADPGAVAAHHQASPERLGGETCR